MDESPPRPIRENINLGNTSGNTTPLSTGRARPKRLSFNDHTEKTPTFSRRKKIVKRRLCFEEPNYDKENELKYSTVIDGAKMQLPDDLDRVQVDLIVDFEYYNLEIADMMDMYQITGSDTFDD